MMRARILPEGSRYDIHTHGELPPDALSTEICPLDIAYNLDGPSDYRL